MLQANAQKQRQGELLFLDHNVSTQRAMTFPTGDATMPFSFLFTCLEACAGMGEMHGVPSERQYKIIF